MLELALRHLLAVIVIVYNIIFVSWCDRADDAFEEIYGAVGSVNEEDSPYFGADVFAHAIKLSSFVGRPRRLLVLLELFPGVQNNLRVWKLGAHGISRRVHMQFWGDTLRNVGTSCVRISVHVRSDEGQQIREVLIRS